MSRGDRKQREKTDHRLLADGAGASQRWCRRLDYNSQGSWCRLAHASCRRGAGRRRCDCWTFRPASVSSETLWLRAVAASGTRGELSLAESATKKTEDNNTLVFTVGVKADKHQIKQAVRKLCDPEVAMGSTLVQADGEKKAVFSWVLIMSFRCAK
ncbi:60S ribosomal protein L23a [Fukomys damarensis]|uniref:60S ribosomal protein L23a n=1 Tax=Fukomys damarensis TaxID=885580 RepID=A0A091CVG7_FUKDA|nr:60S ribosomal protein L23a [Fukomys damarensis]